MSDDRAKLVDEEVSRIVNDAHDRARKILQSRRQLLQKIARLLMVREVLEGKDLRAYVDGETEVPDPEEEARKREKEHAARERKAQKEARRKEKSPSDQAPEDRTMRPLSPTEDQVPNGETEELPRRVR